MICKCCGFEGQEMTEDFICQRCGAENNENGCSYDGSRESVQEMQEQIDEFDRREGRK